MAARARRIAGAVLLGAGAALLAAEAAAAQPRSAIPWLSDSIEAAPVAAPRARPDPPRPPGGAEITVTPLAPISRDGVGLLPPGATGLPRALWGDAPAARVRALLLEHPDQGPPAARTLFRRILLAETDPPAEPEPAADVLLARLDRLLAAGALDEAEALILAAGPDTPEIFRRWFDIGLLTQRAEAQCAALRQNPALSPTLPARVFCLARGGDWNAAEITLTLGQDVGSITPDQEALLARFLDPVLFEEDPAPPVPDPLTALDFTLREAVGLPRPPGSLPLAFLRSDVDQHAPMRMRIEAAERLVLAGSAAPETLFAAYRTGAPAASGGLWDRARAVQTLDARLAEGGPADALGVALGVADAALAARGLRVALADAYAPTLAALDPAPLAPDARTRLVELLLLAGEAEAAARAAGPAPDARVAALLAIAGAAPVPGDAPAPADPGLRAALDGLATRPAQNDRERRLAAAVGAGRVGEALLEGLALLGGAPAGDPAAFEAALFALNAAGQGRVARAAALQVLLQPGEI